MAGLALAALALADACDRATGFLLAAFLLATLDGAIFCAMSLSLYIRVPIQLPLAGTTEPEQARARRRAKDRRTRLAAAHRKEAACRRRLATLGLTAGCPQAACIATPRSAGKSRTPAAQWDNRHTCDCTFQICSRLNHA